MRSFLYPKHTTDTEGYGISERTDGEACQDFLKSPPLNMQGGYYKNLRLYNHAVREMDSIALILSFNRNYFASGSEPFF